MLTSGKLGDPGEGGLRRRDAVGHERGELARGLDPGREVDARERLTHVERLAAPVVCAVVVLGEGGALRVLRSQQAGRQRHARDDAHPRVLSCGEHLVEGLQPERVKDDLDGRHRRPLDGGEGLRGLDAHPVRRDRALVHEGVERVEHRVRLVDRGRWAVQLHEVEHVDAFPETSS